MATVYLVFLKSVTVYTENTFCVQGICPENKYMDIKEFKASLLSIKQLPPTSQIMVAVYNNSIKFFNT